VAADTPTFQPPIADAFEVDFDAPLGAVAAGGLSAWSVRDRREGHTDLMAVEVAPGLPARAAEIDRFRAGAIAGVLSPLAHGVARSRAGRGGLFLICEAPPGPPLIAPGSERFAPWDEATLIRTVLQPAAVVLEQLRARAITHRAIRPDNLFRLAPGEPAILGCAWAAPPAAHQPAICEPPYAAMCMPSGRGPGSIADDVYALGVTLLILALGRVPLAGEDTNAIIQRKLELGSFAALVGDDRLPPVIHDLVRAMLAEDPEHRPAPIMLADTGVTRSRRVAARPPRRAQRPLDIGPHSVWTARTLAFALSREPGPGLHALRSGTVGRWVRRSLGDGQLASRLEDAIHHRAADAETAAPRDGAALAMRAIAILDPLAPLCWNGVALWPNGIGPTLAAAEERDEAALSLAPLAELIDDEAVVTWAAARSERCDVAALRREAHILRSLYRQRGWGGGIPRLRYALNPMLPCRSGLLGDECILRLPDLLPALDRLAGRAGSSGFAAMDREIAAFIAARGDLGLEPDLATLAGAGGKDEQALALLRVLATAQNRTRGAPVPALARWLADQTGPALAVFQGRATRRRREALLAQMSGTGRLAPMLGLIDDAEERTSDRAEHAVALAHAAAIDGQLHALAAGAAARSARAQRIGREGVLAGAMLALIYTVLKAAFG
jgi:eukaryotic-like serine/threonine-protein kinase